ncbi:MAG TPA: hypothetical protein V6C65_20075, partial [Allocoleopsis sp.]
MSLKFANTSTDCNTSQQTNVSLGFTNEAGGATGNPTLSTEMQFTPGEIPGKAPVLNTPIKFQEIDCGCSGNTGGSGGILELAVNSTQSIILSGAGTLLNPLTGNVRISESAGNILEILSDGLYAI